MLRNRIKAGAVAITVALIASACGAVGDGGGGKDEKTLVVANWKDYGSDMKWVTEEFEKKTGAKVVHQYFNSEDELLQMLRTGGTGKIDVALPNLAYVQPAVESDLIQPIDESRVKTLDKIIPELRDSEAVVMDSKRYAVPWVWGATSLAYRTDGSVGEPDSWSTLWDSKNKGKVAYFDDPTTAIMTAALYLGEDPLDPDLAKVKKALIALKPNVKVFWSSADDWTKAFSTGAIDLGNLWSGLAGTSIANDDPVKFVIPKEGGISWADSWAIVKDAPHEDLAYEWINFVTSKEFQVRWANDKDRSSPAPVNVDAQAALSDEVKTRIQAHPEWLSDLTLQTAVPKETLREWTELWQEVKAN